MGCRRGEPGTSHLTAVPTPRGACAASHWRWDEVLLLPPRRGGSCSPAARAHWCWGPPPSSSRRRAAAGRRSWRWPGSSGHLEGERRWLRAAGGPGSSRRAQRPSPPPGEATAHPPRARGAGTRGMAGRGLTPVLDVEEHAAGASPGRWGWDGVCEVRGGRGAGLHRRFPQTLRDEPGRAPSAAELYCSRKPGAQAKERRGPGGTAGLTRCPGGSSPRGRG